MNDPESGDKANFARSEGIPGINDSRSPLEEYVSTIERQIADVDKIWELMQDPKNVVIIGGFKNSRHSGQISLTQRDKLKVVSLGVALKKDGDDILTGNPLFEIPIYDTMRYKSWVQYENDTNTDHMRMLNEDLVRYIDPNVHARASNLTGGSLIHIYQTQDDIDDNFHASAQTLDLDSQILLVLTYATQSQFHSVENLSTELESVLKIFGIVIDHTYKSKGESTPSSKLSISRPRLRKVWKVPIEMAGIDLGELEKMLLIEEIPDVTFEQIGGQKKAVEEAKKLARQLKNPEIFESWGVKPPRGILFYGEPGNGKTLLAKALAHEAESVFMHVNVSDINSKWYGEAEKYAKGIFATAKKQTMETGQHVIIFFDEVDSLMPSRSGGAGDIDSATRRVIGEILKGIDGLESSQDITVIAATNTPEVLDKAFLSRMTKWVEVGNPDIEGIVEIFSIHFSIASKKAGRQLMNNNIDFHSIANMHDGISGREIADAVQVVLSDKANAHIETGIITDITTQDIINAIKSLGKS